MLKNNKNKMKIKLISEIKKFSENYSKLNATKIDKGRQFPKEVTKFFFKKNLRDLLGYHMKVKSLDHEREYEFYYHATKYCSNVRNYFLVSIGMIGSAILKYGTNEQRREYLIQTAEKKAITSLAITEKASGSDINSIKTTYKFLNNKYILNGHKTWITLANKANFFLILANGEFGLLLFYVKKNKNINTKRINNLISNRGSEVAEIRIENLILDEKNLLGGSRKTTEKALKYMLINGRAIASVSACSMVDAALEEAINYSKKRSQFGKRIFQFQQIQTILANSSSKLEASKSLAKLAFYQKRKWGIDGEYYSNTAKFFTTQMANEVISELFNIFGANSNKESFIIERYMREAKGLLFIEGTSQILSQLIASQLIIKYSK